VTQWRNTYLRRNLFITMSHVCMYVCMYIYTHTHTHTHTCMYVCMYVCVCVCICIYYTFTYIIPADCGSAEKCECVDRSLFPGTHHLEFLYDMRQMLYIHENTHIHTYIHICTHTHTHMYTCTYTHI
jgi:hypothetical protein